MSNPVAAITGAIVILVIAVLVMLVIWRLCNSAPGRAAQRAQMPSDYQITTRQDEIVCTSEGCWRIIDGEYVPLDREAA